MTVSEIIKELELIEDKENTDVYILEKNYEPITDSYKLNGSSLYIEMKENGTVVEKRICLIF